MLQRMLWTVVGMTALAAFGDRMALCAETAVHEQPSLRRPAALVFSADERWLYVANRRSGSLSVVDVHRREVVAEQKLGGKIADLAAWRPGQLLAVDEQAHQLLLLSVAGAKVTVAARLPVSRFPVGVLSTHDGARCYVTSLWSRRLTTVALPADLKEPPRVTAVLDLPFAPRRMLAVREDSRLIVADSFGGRLANVDTASGKLLDVRQFPGHNIRGLGTSANGRMLLVSHQMLNELAHTVRNDVHWGLLMSNDLRWLKLDSVLTAGDDDDLYKGAHMHPLGEASSATGDPAGLAVAANGTVVVALAGVGEVALGKENDFSLQRVKVGQRPTAVAIARDSLLAYTADTFDDALSIVDLKQRETIAKIPLGPQAELSAADRGELLFFDASISHDSWMSCHSCHTDGHTNGLLNDNFSDASFGAPKRVISLLGRAGTEPFAWNASSPDFDAQIRKTIANTMQSDQPPSDRQVELLTAYLKTLQPPPSIDVARETRDDAAVARGSKVFEAQGCVRCHKAPTYTTPQTYDVGLTDKEGNKRFNPPSLRGVGQRGPYFHDGSAQTLSEVFRKFDHPLRNELSDDELADLLAFLRSL